MFDVMEVSIFCHSRALRSHCGQEPTAQGRRESANGRSVPRRSYE